MTDTKLRTGWCGHWPPIDGCHRCGLVRTRAGYRRHWLTPEQAEQVTPTPMVSTRDADPLVEFAAQAERIAEARARFALPACPHLGAATGREVRCSTCTQKVVMEPVRACAIYGECTTDKLSSGIECCRICKHPDNPRRPKAAAGVKT